VSVREGTTLRDECRSIKPGEFEKPVPMDRWEGDVPMHAEIQARPTYRVVEEWRRWMIGYRNSHIEYESPDGETVRGPLENSYQDRYNRRYYARLKDLERGIEREFDSLTTVMLTFTASHRNAEGNWRCPADHMRDVVDGWDVARKELYRALAGCRWEYARILEPHADGYGHLHVAVFVEDAGDELDAERFRSTMEAHVRACSSAGPEAHTNEGCGDHDVAQGGCDECRTPVSVNHDVGNVASYLSEYLGMYGETEALERPMNEQAFYAVTWATNTRRIAFSNGAQEIIADQKWRRETGLRAEDRGGAGGAADDAGYDLDGAAGGEAEAMEPADDGDGWEVTRLCTVEDGGPNYYDPSAGGVKAGPIDGRSGVDPPKQVGPPG
jgi:hypothetical protein